MRDEPAIRKQGLMISKADRESNRKRGLRLEGFQGRAEYCEFKASFETAGLFLVLHLLNRCALS